MRRSVLILAFALAGCGVGSSVRTTTVNSVTVDGVTTTHTVTTTTNAGTAAPAATASLAPFVGHYPDDQVNGAGFWSTPLVQTAVLSAVADPAIQRVILHPNGPSGPIGRMPDGRIVAQTCEVHNCGPHNWSLLVADDGSNPEVCYHDDTASPPTRWFKYGQQTRAGGDDCPTGEQPAAPATPSAGGK